MLLAWTKEIKAGWLWWKKALPHFLTGQILLSPKRTRLRGLVWLPFFGCLKDVGLHKSFSGFWLSSIQASVFFSAAFSFSATFWRLLHLKNKPVCMCVYVCVCKIIPVKTQSDSMTSLLLFLFFPCGTIQVSEMLGMSLLFLGADWTSWHREVSRQDIFKQNVTEM